MSEYIAREAVEVALNHRLSFLTAENSEYDRYVCGYEEAVTTVENFPSVDAVSVVRCKDCKYFGRELEGGKHDCADYNLPYCRPDDFCSHGVQKEAASTDE